jgi:hypothetical protein
LRRTEARAIQPPIAHPSSPARPTAALIETALKEVDSATTTGVPHRHAAGNPGSPGIDARKGDAAAGDEHEDLAHAQRTVFMRQDREGCTALIE